jgi:hypothetical protein
MSHCMASRYLNTPRTSNGNTLSDPIVPTNLNTQLVHTQGDHFANIRDTRLTNTRDAVPTELPKAPVLPQSTDVCSLEVE